MNCNRITIEAPGLTIHLDPRPADSARMHGRAHLWNTPGNGTLTARRDALRFVFNAVAARSPRQIPGLHDEHGFKAEGADTVLEGILANAVWRSTAGCSCRCSPGFILKDFPYDVYATWA